MPRNRGTGDREAGGDLAGGEVPLFQLLQDWRRVGSASARKARETDFIVYNLAIWLIFVKRPNLTTNNLPA